MLKNFKKEKIFYQKINRTYQLIMDIVSIKEYNKKNIKKSIGNNI